jgi:hypothetical protein
MSGGCIPAGAVSPHQQVSNIIMTHKKQNKSKVIGNTNNLTASKAKAPSEASRNNSKIITTPFSAARRELREQGILGKTPEGADCVIIPNADALRIADDPALSPWKAMHIACLLFRGCGLQPVNIVEYGVIEKLAHRLRPWIEERKKEQALHELHRQRTVPMAA